MKLKDLINSQDFEKSSKNLTGFILPSGHVFETEIYEHFEALKKIPNIPESLKWFIDEQVAELDQIEDEANQRIEEGEHPEWHIWEMAQSDVYSNVRTEIYKHGFIRYFVSFSDNQANVTLEGFLFNAHYDTISQLKENENLNLRIEYA